MTFSAESTQSDGWGNEGRVNFRQLRYFAATVEAGSFTGASKKLRISQPALGLQVKQLEDELGVSLLVRHSRGIDLTKEGEIMYQSARKILDELSAVSETLRRGRSMAEVFRLGLAPSASVLLSERLLNMVKEAMPGVELQMVEAPSSLLRVWMIDRSLDVALGCEGEPFRKDITESPLYSEALYYVTKPTPTTPHSNSNEIDFYTLADRKILIADPMRRGLIEKKISSAAIATGTPVRVAEVYPSVETTKLLVEDGRGGAILPWFSVRREVEQGRLAAARIVNPSLSRLVLQSTHTGAPLTKCQMEVMNLLRIAVQEEVELAPVLALKLESASEPLATQSDYLDLAQRRPLL